jgi:UPF0716 family protein affecting phage T7 exclusion
MPFFFLFFLILPIALDVLLTVWLAGALSIPTWAMFLVPMLAGFVLLVLEWSRVQAQWREMRQLRGSPLGLMGSARRGFAAILLILPGIGSDCLALFILLTAWFKPKAQIQSQTFVFRETFRQPPPDANPPPKNDDNVIEGEYRRDV